MLKDQSPDDWHLCVVLDCRRTGKVREPERPFVCTLHVGKCGEPLIRDHTRRAAALIDLERRHARKPSLANRDLVAARFTESMAWSRIVSKAGEIFGFKEEFLSKPAG